VRISEWVDKAPIAPQEVARLGAGLALALHDLHRQDVVHLDLKPSNVLYRPSGEAVLIDFGLARHGHFPDLLAEELRYPVGNWSYMAPEQIVGVRCDPRSDIYALGGILYHLATGRLPHGKPATIAELRKRLAREPLPPRALPDTPPGCRRSSCIASRSTREQVRVVCRRRVRPRESRAGRATARGERCAARACVRARRWLRARHYEPDPARRRRRSVHAAHDGAIPSTPFTEAQSSALRDAARPADRGG
jgi:serine/threonine protein kinase